MTSTPVGDDLDARDASEWMRLARSGDLAAAWTVSDRIRARKGGTRDWSLPRHVQQIWEGAPFDGRRILVRCYHGLGDTIQFIRYIPLVRAKARSVTVWAQPALLPLLGTISGIDELLPLHDGVPDIEYDVDIEIMGLPYAFRTTLATIPDVVPYLSADARPLGGHGLRVGIAWRAGDWNSSRSIPFSQLRPLLDVDGASFYSLQLDRTADERHDNLRIVDTDGLVIAAETMAAMDVVISVDSMQAHLAGALGVPVWTLLPFDADWRWMEQRADSPWYPTMRLFRQRSPGTWPQVIDNVCGALRAVGRRESERKGVQRSWEHA